MYHVNAFWHIYSDGTSGACARHTPTIESRVTSVRSCSSFRGMGSSMTAKACSRTTTSAYDVQGWLAVLVDGYLSIPAFPPSYRCQL